MSSMTKKFPLTCFEEGGVDKETTIAVFPLGEKMGIVCAANKERGDSWWGWEKRVRKSSSQRPGGRRE